LTELGLYLYFEDSSHGSCFCSRKPT